MDCSTSTAGGVLQKRVVTGKVVSTANRLERWTPEMPVPLILLLLSQQPPAAVTVTGRILDADTGQLLPARLYVEDDGGRFFTAESSDKKQVVYDKRRGNSVEVHTSLPPQQFSLELPPGIYRFTAERGHEYRSAVRRVEVGSAPVEVDLRLRRWVNMADRGWFSGDTHVHRRLSELPAVMLAEDLNVAFPLTAWVTDTEQSPASDNRNPEPIPPARLIRLDDTHVIWPVNTEYEHFSVSGKRHTLGAVFVLNHSSTLDVKAPPVAPLARRAREENALLELDKHNWPWSMMIAPVMKVDLFELSNNHIWRTDFMFRSWYPEYAPPSMEVSVSDGFTERQWIEFGFWNYYALLNCGLRMMPTAGTASGVHPVPLGFGRVYVQQPDGFQYESWVKALREGRSFVTTGPMLFAEYSDLATTSRSDDRGHFSIEVRSQRPLSALELIINGDVHAIESSSENDGCVVTRARAAISSASSGWACVRCYEQQPDGRVRFAHSAPAYFHVPGKPVTPTRAQATYLLKRVTDEIERHRGVLSAEAIAEYETARRFYQQRLQSATR